MSEELKQDELETLKARADQLGISYHPSIGVDKLREKVKAKLDGEQDSAAAAPAKVTESENAFRLRKRKEAEELVRVMVTNMNPHKKEWEGEKLDAGNSVVGTHRKYVPFGVEWHVPRIIFNMLKQRQCQIFRTRRDERGRQVREGVMIPEFNVVELPPLSEKELKELAQRQAMAAGAEN